jgi:transposase
MNTVAFAEARKARGQEIARSLKIVKVSDRFYAVPSQQTKGKYAVDPEAGTCMCPDYETHGKPCKHVYAVMYARHQITDSDGTTVVTETLKTLKISYAQNWPAYNRAQVSEKETVQTLLKDLCSGIGQPKYKGNGRPALAWGDAVYGCTMKVYSGMSARRASTDIRDCVSKGLIDDAPHYNTVLRYLDKPELTPLLKTLVEESASPLKAVESNFAVDSTGFHTNTYARWFDEKYGKERKYQKWIKAHAMVGVKTNIVTSVEVTEGNRGDSLEFAGLVHSTAQRFTMSEVSADKAYLSNENLELVESFNAIPYIPFKSNSRADGADAGAAWKRLWHLFNAQRDDFASHYHRRSNVETTFSALKRKFGTAVRAKNTTAQANEVLAKILCHNLACLVHEIHELNIDPKFWAPKAVQ